MLPSRVNLGCVRVLEEVLVDWVERADHLAPRVVRHEGYMARHRRRERHVLIRDDFRFLVAIVVRTNWISMVLQRERQLRSMGFPLRWILMSNLPKACGTIVHYHSIMKYRDMSRLD